MSDTTTQTTLREALTGGSQAEAKALRACLRAGDVAPVLAALYRDMATQDGADAIDDVMLEFGKQRVEASTIDNGYIRSLRWESHKRGKNWTASVRHDPGSRGGLARTFWTRRAGYGRDR